MSSLFFKPLNYYLENKFVCNKKFKDTYSGVGRIIVIGDIHGDFNILVKCLIKGKVINNNHKWIGGSTHVVQLGDLLDKGGRGVDSMANSMEEFSIYEFLNYLDNEAEKTGGKVHYLIGNHELMNMHGDFRYVHTSHLEDTGSDIRRQLFRAGGYMAKLLACHSYGVLKINKWYFCHAGLLPEHINTRSITKINTIVRGILRGDRPGKLTAEEDEIINSPNSIFWNRYYTNNSNTCDTLTRTLNILKEKDGGMVVGHTPHKNITSVCNEKLWFADVGLSDGFGDTFNNIQILSIINNIPQIIT